MRIIMTEKNVTTHPRERNEKVNTFQYDANPIIFETNK